MQYCRKNRRPKNWHLALVVSKSRCNLQREAAFGNAQNVGAVLEHIFDVIPSIALVDKLGRY